MIPKKRSLNRFGVGCVLLLCMFQVLFCLKFSQAAVGNYEYEQKDKTTEKKKSIQRLERDKQKVVLAIETISNING